LGKQFERLPVMALRLAEDGKLWVLFAEQLDASSRGGLAVAHNDRWLTELQFMPEELQVTWRGHFLVADVFGALWLPGYGDLCRYASGAFSGFSVPDVDGDEFPLCALCDREGTLWIGTESSGLQQWIPRTLVTYTTEEGLVNDDVWTICPTRDGSIWLGTEGGISRFKEGRFTSFPMAMRQPESNVRSIVEDHEGNIWFGTIRALHRIQNGIITDYKFPGEWEETKIRALQPARDGSLWVGTVRGLTRLAGAERVRYAAQNGLPAQEVRALLQDRKGDIWVGTYGGGLSFLRDGRFQTITTTNGLSNSKVWALHEDGDSFIWAGTEDGLNRIKDGKIIAFRTREGLPEAAVNSIVEDDLGRLWMSGNRCIYWVRKSQFDEVAAGRAARIVPVIYGTPDGLPLADHHGQTSWPAGCKGRDGRLWFPTSKGAVVINPAIAVTDEVAPKTVLERVRANGRIVAANSPVDDEDNVTSEALQAPDALIDFPAGGARVIEFHYTANTFLAPEQTRFRYRLRGVNNEWTEADTRRDAYFADLRPGNYVFEVVAASRHALWAKEPAALRFRIAPYYYQTWWFLALTVSGLIGLVAVAVTWRTREIRRIHDLERFSAINQQRRRIARDIHDELGASLTHILQMSLEAGHNGQAPEKLHALTRRIAAIAGEAIDSIGEIVWANNPEYDTLEDLVAFLREYGAKFLADSSMEVDLEFPEVIPSRAVTGILRRHLLMFLKESLQNVLKHSKASRVHISLKLEPLSLTLLVADDGVGLSNEKVRRWGNGLRNMVERIEELGGRCEFESLPGRGTTVRASVPLP
jgi:signal transduction histidine kinase/streptogramin lyase